MESFHEDPNVDASMSTAAMTTSMSACGGTAEDESREVGEAPPCTPIYISTKTKFAYLSSTVPLQDVFWRVPLMPYACPREGVVKKEMKFNSQSPSELEALQRKLVGYQTRVEEKVIWHVDNVYGRNKYKDSRKISIGICAKNIACPGSKQTKAFYNCFVLMVRVRTSQGMFKEFHVKVFNSGKLEIPGIQDEALFEHLLTVVVEVLRPWVPVGENNPLRVCEGSSETVLVNSNFHCGYGVNREALIQVLKRKYHLHPMWESCSYPGVKCRFKDRQVTFMIFRTGSVLIVGRCDETVLMEVYEYLCSMFRAEYREIRLRKRTMEDDETFAKGSMASSNKKKKRSTRCKFILVESHQQPLCPAMETSSSG